MLFTSEPGPGASANPLTITLTPLLDQGPAALAPVPAMGIVKVLWVKANYRWHNAFNESTVRKADDLFACSVQDGGYDNPIPKAADLTGVTLEFYFTGAPAPHWVELSPPHIFILQHPEDRGAVLEFLKRREFIIL